jgi:hypothetical protein
MSLITHNPGESAAQYNIVIYFSSTQNQYVVSPGNAVIPAGFGEGEGGGRVGWFLVPKEGDTLTFNVSAVDDQSGGVNFMNAPPFLQLSYSNDKTIAMTPWVNSLAKGDPMQMYNYDVYVLVNGEPLTIDPDVENPPPNSGGG